MSKLPGVAMTQEIERSLSLGEKCVVAIGVSGGKDSFAAAIATYDYLKLTGFRGKIVLIHSDLGMVEWNQSLPKCKELADHLDLELITVQRKAGGMMERWESRWAANVKRFENLECVKLILPWSTPSMRFCTSELKVSPITSELKKRYRGHCIINVVGIRRQESSGRAKAPVSKLNKKLGHKTVCKETGLATHGYDWNSIIEWQVEDVFKIIDQSGLALHEAYTDFGLGRVSCRFCILASLKDLRAASLTDEARQLYLRMVQLEIKSTFAFQSTRWLGDVNTTLLPDDMKREFREAKARAALREDSESMIPKHLLYVKGWPVGVPSEDDARLLSRFRIRVGAMLGLDMKYTDPGEIRNRYRELIAIKESKAKPKSI